MIQKSTVQVQSILGLVLSTPTSGAPRLIWTHHIH